MNKITLIFFFLTPFICLSQTTNDLINIFLETVNSLADDKALVYQFSYLDFDDNDVFGDSIPECVRNHSQIKKPIPFNCNSLGVVIDIGIEFHDSDFQPQLYTELKSLFDIDACNLKAKYSELDSCNQTIMINWSNHELNEEKIKIKKNLNRKTMIVSRPIILNGGRHAIVKVYMPTNRISVLQILILQKTNDSNWTKIKEIYGS